MTGPSSPSPPSGRLVMGIFCLLGVGILLPWNAFISAKSYFEARLCSDESYSGSNVELWFGLVYNGSSVVSLGILIWMQWRRDKQQSRDASTQRLQNTESPRHGANQSWWMVMLPLYVYLGVFLLTTGMVVIKGISPSFFFRFTLLSLSVCGVCTAFASAGIVGTAGLFPAETGTHPYFSGQALGGVVVAIANLIAASLHDPQAFSNEYCGDDRRMISRRLEESACMTYDTIDWSSFSYFLVGTIVLGMCIVGYSYVESFKKAMLLAPYETLEESFEDEPKQEMRLGGDSVVLEDDNVELPSVAPSYEVAASIRAPGATNPSQESDEDNATHYVWHAVKGPAFAIFFTFVVTLALFPGWTSELQSVRQCQSKLRVNNDLYTPMTFVIFNAGDFLGRLFSTKLIRDPTRALSRPLVVTSLSRCAFFPLFLLCMARGSTFDSLAIRSDLFSFLVQSSFAILNGMVVSLSFIHAPTLLPATQDMQTKASEMLNFALSFGLLCGSMLSFPFSKVATGHW